MLKWIILLLFCAGCVSPIEEITNVYEDDAGDDMTRGRSQSFVVTSGQSGIQGAIQANWPEIEVYTVMFDINNQSAASIQATAIINWMVGGNNIRRVVSIGSGVSLSAPCEGVNVQIEDTTPAAAVTAGATYVVTVTVAKGVRPSKTQPVLLASETALHQFNIIPTGNAVAVIPPNSGVTSVLVLASNEGASATDGYVSFQEGIFTLGTYDLGPPYGEFVSIPVGATQIQINNFGANNMFVSVQWGIDG